MKAGCWLNSKTQQMTGVYKNFSGPEGAVQKE